MIFAFNFFINQAFYGEKKNLLNKESMTFSLNIKIGTRGSALALYQAQQVQKALNQAALQHGIPLTTTLVIIKTTGDKITDRPLHTLGGKALFTKEIDHALLKKQIDIGVHSLKDCETWIHPLTMIAASLCREDPRDVLISASKVCLQNLPPQTTIGTCSLRRQSQILHIRPDLKIVPFRGNVPTRLSKVQQGEAQATLLALAGLKRLNLTEKIAEIFPPEVITPCVGQGAISVICRQEDQKVREILKLISHPPTDLQVHMERSFLEEINGSCKTPVGGLFTLLEDQKTAQFIACVATEDGQHLWREKITCPLDRAEQEVKRLGKEMHQWLHQHGV